ncbi:MAG: hypothetical protein PVF35_00665 [Gammaproteobacteria bacterium]
MVNLVTETFFLPPEVDRQAWSVPAEIYNLYRSLLSKSVTGNVFVPIRTMQFLAVMDKNEIIFVDSQSYAVSGNEGGRLILIAWKFNSKPDRDALSDPVPCDVIFYERKDRDTQLRLVREFRESLELMDQRYRDEQMPAEGAKILHL